MSHRRCTTSQRVAGPRYGGSGLGAYEFMLDSSQHASIGITDFISHCV